MSTPKLHRFCRRDLLAGATSTGLLLAASPAFAQPRGRRRRGPSIPVKEISPSLYLTQETVRAASSFQVGGKGMPLRVSPQNAAGVVYPFPLPREMASRLEQKSGLLEAATIGISDAQSLARLRQHVTSSGLEMPQAAQANLEKVPFFFVQSAWREDTGQDAMALANAKRQLATDRHHFAFALVPLEGSARGIQSAALVIVSGLASFLEKWMLGDEEEEPEPPEAEPTPSPGNEDDAQDFAKCYLGCIDDAMDNYIVLLVAAALCGTCTAAMAALTFPGGQAVSIPAAIATCSLCAGAIGAVAGNCLVGCHEML